ncbi:unnamed protein product [Cochlearia groenlandica]
MFCASQASTAIANDEHKVVARAMDRQNPILIKDGRRSFTAPCSSGDDYIAPYRKITRIPSSSSSSKSCEVNKTTLGSTRNLLGTKPVSLTGSTGKDEIVVVLRVSLHCNCRGCQSKVKKHLSKMQGVTSFNIDFASKKVTVTGDITPLDVLGCLSKVKNAQFWTPPQASLPRANPEY